ncbi:MAG: recombinase family protein [Bacilli bacterium]|nr:recombinase family protein [Bacilli bacterium]
MNNKYKVGIYLRLSREDENLGESGSIKTQRDLIHKYINDNNLTFIDEYVDDGVSGTTFNRLSFSRMIRDCESKKINMIITKDTSRLGRDHIEFGYYVEKYFPEHNIRYVAINDGIDTFSNSSNNDMLVFKSAFNDMYVKDISNKIKSSLYIKKVNGLFIGAYAPYGYNKDPLDNHKLIINNDEALIVKRIFNLFIEGYSISKICNILTLEKIPTPSVNKNMNIRSKCNHIGVWSQRTVNSILKNEIYIGNLVQGKQRKVSYKSKKRIRTSKEEWIISKNVVPNIISEQVFNQAKSIFEINKHISCVNNITNNLLLRGLIYCSECGHKITFRNVCGSTNNYIYGTCSYYIKRKNEKLCSPHNVKYEDIEFLILDDIKKHLNYVDFDLLKLRLENSKMAKCKNDILRQKIIHNNNELLIINNKIDIIYNDKLDKKISDDLFSRQYDKFQEQIKLIETENIKLEEELKRYDKNDISILDELVSDLKNNKIDRKLILKLINRIEIDEDRNINIFYNFTVPM